MKVVINESPFPARYIHVKMDSEDLFSKVHTAILEKFKDAELSARAIRIYWKDEVGDEVEMSESDDLISAIETTINGSCTLYIHNNEGMHPKVVSLNKTSSIN